MLFSESHIEDVDSDSALGACGEIHVITTKERTVANFFKMRYLNCDKILRAATNTLGVSGQDPLAGAGVP
jgi:hypothetical protein